MHRYFVMTLFWESSGPVRCRGGNKASMSLFRGVFYETTRI